jgi:hypothetical protein
VNQSGSCTTLIFLVISGVGTALAYAMHIADADVEAVGIGIGTFILAWSFLPQSRSVIEINFQ